MHGLLKDQVLLLTGALMLAVATGCDTFGFGFGGSGVVNRALAEIRPVGDHTASGLVGVSQTGDGLEIDGRFRHLGEGTYQLRLLEPGACTDLVLEQPDGRFAYGHPLESPRTNTWTVLDARKERFGPDAHGRAEFASRLRQGAWSWDEDGVLGRPVVLERVDPDGATEPVGCGVLHPLRDA